MNWLGLLLRVLPMIVPTVQQVEASRQDLKGPDKKKAVLDLVGAGLGVIDGVAGRDVLNHPVISDAASHLIDTVVAIHNHALVQASGQPSNPVPVPPIASVTPIAGPLPTSSSTPPSFPPPTGDPGSQAGSGNTAPVSGGS